MCGRFAQHSSISVLKKTFHIDTVTCDIKPNYNIAPTHPVLSIIYHNGNRLGKLHWGLVPSWSKDLSKAAGLINARAETLDKRPSFRQAFKQRRCLIIADGFYEWKKENNVKQPWYFALPSGDPFAFAGLWETWKHNDGSAYHSCAIITTGASESVSKIHNRMPAILLPDARNAWLDPTIHDSNKLKKILMEGCLHDVQGFPVSKRIDSATNNDAACMEPIQTTRHVAIDGGTSEKK